MVLYFKTTHKAKKKKKKERQDQPKFSILAESFLNNFSKILSNQLFFDQNLKISAENFWK